MASADDPGKIESAMHLDDGEMGETKECGGVIFEKMGAMWTAVGGTDGFHEVKDMGNHLIGKTGAMSYVLDDTGSVISTGHHKISGVGPFSASTGGAQYTLTSQGGIYVPDDPAQCRELLNEEWKDFNPHVESALRARAHGL